MGDEVEVIDNEAESRFEARSQGEFAGILTYRRRPGRISLIHTEVYGRFGGRGIRTRIAVAALDAVRAGGLAVLPICPLVADYIDHHPEYQALVAEGFRAPRSRARGGHAARRRVPRRLMTRPSGSRATVLPSSSRCWPRYPARAQTEGSNRLWRLGVTSTDRRRLLPAVGSPIGRRC